MVAILPQTLFSSTALWLAASFNSILIHQHYSFTTSERKDEPLEKKIANNNGKMKVLSIWAHGKNENLWMKSWQIRLKMTIIGLQLTYYFSNGLFLIVQNVSFKSTFRLGLPWDRGKNGTLFSLAWMENLKRELITIQRTKFFESSLTQSSKMFFSLGLQRQAYQNDFKAR